MKISLTGDDLLVVRFAQRGKPVTIFYAAGHRDPREFRDYCGLSELVGFTPPLDEVNHGFFRRIDGGMLISRNRWPGMAPFTFYLPGEGSNAH